MYESVCPLSVTNYIVPSFFSVQIAVVVGAALHAIVGGLVMEKLHYPRVMSIGPKFSKLMMLNVVDLQHRHPKKNRVFYLLYTPSSANGWRPIGQKGRWT